MRFPARIGAAATIALCVTALAQQEVHGVRIANMDPSAVPGDHWYTYANGKYLARTEIPPDRTSISSFSSLANIVNERVAGIIEAAGKSNPALGTEKRKIADLYASYMNTAALEAGGTTALKPRLDAIAAIQTRTELATALGKTLRADVDALNNTNFHTMNLFGVWVAPGFNDPDHYTPYLMQGGDFLPTRDYYLADSPRMKDVRAKYLAHIAAMLTLAGYDQAATRAQGILDLETAIAQKQISLAERRRHQEGEQRVANAGVCDQGSRPGLDGILRGCRPGQAGELHRVAADCGHGGGRPGDLYADRDVARLPGFSPPGAILRRSARRVFDGILQLRRQDAERGAADASSRSARRRAGKCRARRRRWPAVRSEVFPIRG